LARQFFQRLAEIQPFHFHYETKNIARLVTTEAVINTFVRANRETGRLLGMKRTIGLKIATGLFQGQVRPDHFRDLQSVFDLRNLIHKVNYKTEQKEYKSEVYNYEDMAQTHEFKAILNIIGINPFVSVPQAILDALFKEAGKDKGAVPVRGTVNNLPFTQTLVRFHGEWRLYVNMKMLKNSPRHVGETISITIDYDPKERTIPMHPDLAKALDDNIDAKSVFDRLSPSRRHEINRYISNLKSEAKIRENVERAVNFLNGDGSFAGRDKPEN
jgi:hypothetical protein